MSEEPLSMDIAEDYSDIRKQITKLCEDFPGEYWRALGQANVPPHALDQTGTDLLLQRPFPALDWNLAPLGELAL